MKTPQDDQHTVYTTGAGSVVGSGSAALPKQLLIRSSKQLPTKSPENSPNKLKSKKPREGISTTDLDDFYSD